MTEKKAAKAAKAAGPEAVERTAAAMGAPRGLGSKTPKQGKRMLGAEEIGRAHV